MREGGVYDPGDFPDSPPDAPGVVSRMAEHLLVRCTPAVAWGLRVLEPMLGVRVALAHARSAGEWMVAVSIPPDSSKVIHDALVPALSALGGQAVGRMARGPAALARMTEPWRQRAELRALRVRAEDRLRAAAAPSQESADDQAALERIGAAGTAWLELARAPLMMAATINGDNATALAMLAQSAVSHAEWMLLSEGMALIATQRPDSAVALAWNRGQEAVSAALAPAPSAVGAPADFAPSPIALGPSDRSPVTEHILVRCHIRDAWSLRTLEPLLGIRVKPVAEASDNRWRVVISIPGDAMPGTADAVQRALPAFGGTEFVQRRQGPRSLQLMSARVDKELS